jgi:hypothetical protein
VRGAGAGARAESCDVCSHLHGQCGEQGLVRGQSLVETETICGVEHFVPRAPLHHLCAAAGDALVAVGPVVDPVPAMPVCSLYFDASVFTLLRHQCVHFT